MMCPLTSKMACPMGGDFEMMVCIGVKIFLLVWVIFVPIVMTNRLERIIKLLQDKK
ncbi:MAG: hypothetical protein WC676_03140 [Candidatus Omnitrophota bacterium]